MKVNRNINATRTVTGHLTRLEPYLGVWRHLTPKLILKYFNFVWITKKWMKGLLFNYHILSNLSAQHRRSWDTLFNCKIENCFNGNVVCGLFTRSRFSVIAQFFLRGSVTDIGRRLPSRCLQPAKNSSYSVAPFTSFDNIALIYYKHVIFWI